MKYFNFLVLFCFLISCKKETTEEPIGKKLKKTNMQSLSCEMSSNLSVSYVFYEKPDVFFINTYFLGQKELTVSSNGEIYWFWMKRFDKESVYYCDLDNLEKTRIRHPMNPVLIRSFLCLEPEKEISFVGKYKRIVKLKENKIAEQHWFLNEIFILSIYVIEYDDEYDIPKSIKVIWHEEKKILEIKIRNVKINPDKKPNQSIPNLRRINLENY